jgi:hypothetical protein
VTKYNCDCKKRWVGSVREWSLNVAILKPFGHSHKQRTAASIAYDLSPPSERAFCLAKPLRHARACHVTACSHTRSSGSTGNIARAASYQGNTHKYCWPLEASETGGNINLCASEVICRPGNPAHANMLCSQHTARLSIFRLPFNAPVCSAGFMSYSCLFSDHIHQPVHCCR